VAIIAAMRMLFSDLTHDSQGRPNPQSDHEQLIYWRKRAGNETVLSINIAGRPPYAVFVPDLTSPAEKPATIAPWLYPWLPVLVSPTGAVEVVWDEVPPWTSISRSRTLAAYEQQLSTIDPVSYPPPAAPRVFSFGAAAPPAAHQQGVVVPPAVHSQAVVVPPAAVALPLEAHQQAAAFAHWLGTLPADQQAAAVAGARASLDPMAPPVREAYLALWRSLGVRV
jgi:hypothetical protein